MPEMECYIDKTIPVLDQGFVRLVDVMGTDSSIVQAARVSYGAGTKTPSDDAKLIGYLMKNRHTTPFEMCELKFHVRVPMDCWRQWIRHRSANVNEYSTRYSEAIDAMQKTRPEEWRAQSSGNKQGSEGSINDKHFRISDDLYMLVSTDLTYGDFSLGEYLTWRENQLHKLAREIYEERLHFGVAREQARKDLPLSTYTEAYWKIDLHNLLHFLSLRMDSHAQIEIRSYANAIALIVSRLFPITWDAFNNFRLIPDEQAGIRCYPGKPETA